MDNHGFDSENSINQNQCAIFVWDPAVIALYSDKNKKVYSKFCMVKHSNNKFQKSSNIW